MGDWIELTAADGHKLAAYKAGPVGAPAAGLVIAHEIFGVNVHIRDVVDRFAGVGYRAIAPAYIDRVERGVELDYTPDNVVTGRDLRGQLTWETVIADTNAAIAALATAKTGLVGYCFGGTIAWIAAESCPIDVAVGYYGGQIPAEVAR